MTMSSCLVSFDMTFCFKKFNVHRLWRAPYAISNWIALPVSTYQNIHFPRNCKIPKWKENADFRLEFRPARKYKFILIYYLWCEGALYQLWSSATFFLKFLLRCNREGGKNIKSLW